MLQLIKCRLRGSVASPTLRKMAGMVVASRLGWATAGKSVSSQPPPWKNSPCEGQRAETRKGKRCCVDPWKLRNSLWRPRSRSIPSWLDKLSQNCLECHSTYPCSALNPKIFGSRLLEFASYPLGAPRPPRKSAALNSVGSSLVFSPHPGPECAMIRDIFWVWNA